MPSKDEFLYPRNRYHGAFKPENLAFNANLQEFSQVVGYTCAMETGGKITPEEAYKSIKKAWKDLKRSKKGLGIGQDNPGAEEPGTEK